VTHNGQTRHDTCQGSDAAGGEARWQANLRAVSIAIQKHRYQDLLPVSQARPVVTLLRSTEGRPSSGNLWQLKNSPEKTRLTHRGPAVLVKISTPACHWGPTQPAQVAKDGQ
jgi:hypothetical protein